MKELNLFYFSALVRSECTHKQIQVDSLEIAAVLSSCLEFM